MRLATRIVEGQNHVAVVTAEGLVDLVEAAASHATPLTEWQRRDLTALLDGGPEALAAAAALADQGQAVPLDETQLGPPLPAPRKLLLLAGNYAEHIMEGGRRLHACDQATPRVFIKPPSTTLGGPRADIPIPPLARFIDWEAELAVVIGRRGKAISAADAADYIAGYMVLNDVSERDLLIKERPEKREIDGFFDWLNGKWLDGFAPCGPWLTTADEVPDPHALDIRLTVNDTVHQEGNTGQMIFHVEDIIAYISAIVTLEPGDIIATGTCAGVGHGKGVRLAPGDVVTTTITGLGTLVNTCRATER